MKRFLLILSVAAAALALAACSKTQVVSENQGTGISFRASIFNQTKAGNVTDIASLKDATNGGFHVVAFEETAANTLAAAAHMAVDVTWASSAWTYGSTLYYWPSVDQLDFWAYAPKSVTGATITSTDRKIEGFAPAAAASGQKDLVVAYNEGTRSTMGSGVSLNFKHALSQIYVKAKVGSNLTVMVKQVKICRALKSATLALPGIGVVTENSLTTYPVNASWSTFADTESYTSSELTTPVTLSSTAAAVQGDYSFMVLPQTVKAAGETATAANGELLSWNAEGKGTAGTDNSGLYMAFLVKVTYGSTDIYPNTPSVADDYAWTAVPIPARTWEPGKKYTYTVAFDPNNDGSLGYYEPDVATNGGKPVYGRTPIVFTTITVDDWTDVTPGDINITE